MRLLPPLAAPDAQLCVFLLGGQEFAVDLRRVAEIITPLPVVPLPRGPAFLEGVIHLRGALVPVVDPHRQLGLTPQAGGRPKMLICLVGRRKVALQVDGVVQVLKVKRSELKPSPPVSGPGEVPYFLGACGQEARLRLLLNVKAFLELEAAPDPIARQALADAGQHLEER